MKKITLILFFLGFLNSLFANKLEIETSTSRPVVSEEFMIRFKIQTTSDKQPKISFDPVQLDILSRNNEGISIQTSIINGVSSIKREIIYSYEVISHKKGVSFLKNIKVKLGKKTLHHNDIVLKIFPERKKSKNIFLKAEVSKNEVFIGEGIDVRYYLYSKFRVMGMEIKKFPTLEGMIKRFHNVKENRERVNYQGELYTRSLKYSARVYPEKIGTVYIDPMRIKIHSPYPEGRHSLLGAFRMALGQTKKRTLRSRSVPIKVKPIPGKMPSNFTGLVGKHTFKIFDIKEKYLVNEAIELRMEITGLGALENFDDIALYKDPHLEVFETKSEVVELNSSLAKKVVDYTYLPRDEINQEKRDLVLSYFNPEKEIFEEASIPLPAIKVRSLVTASTPPMEKTIKKNYQNQTSLVAPIFDISFSDSIKTEKNRIFLVFLFVIFFFQIIEVLIFKGIFLGKSKSLAKNIYQEIKKNGINYSRLYSLLSLLDSRETNLEFLLKKSSLREDATKYFLDLLKSLEQTSFSRKSDGKKIILKTPYFKELLALLSDEKNKKNV